MAAIQPLEKNALPSEKFSWKVSKFLTNE